MHPSPAVAGLPFVGDHSGAAGTACPRNPFPNPVNFAYPGSSRPVLKDFDLTIPAGSSLAIVGLNCPCHQDDAGQTSVPDVRPAVGFDSTIDGI